jgi:hypothetical protein
MGCRLGMVRSSLRGLGVTGGGFWGWVDEVLLLRKKLEEWNDRGGVAVHHTL